MRQSPELLLRLTRWEVINAATCCAMVHLNRAVRGRETRTHSATKQQQPQKLHLELCGREAVLFSEMSHVQLSSSALERLVARRTFPLQRRTGVCRSLFGPVDHDELERDVKAKLREISERDRERWNFNFEDNTPLEGDYEWEEVAAEKTAAFYRESASSGRTRTPATPVKQTPPSDSGAPESPGADVMERLAAPESGDGISATPVEANQENRPVRVISGTCRQTPCARRKRTAAAAADNNTHITDFFVKRKKVADRLPKSPISVEQTPRKRIR
ncbi:uncharacterized protein cdkn1cb isoform 1-T1 [Fundulus diaphanus]